MERLLTLIASYLVLTLFTSVSAQIVPDESLPNNSVVDRETQEITGGTTAGKNLFHSFSEFSVITNGTAFFNNALTIENIISRVTGNSISNIDGLIRANGGANLFLINPNGIIFGENAALNVGGSFISSTADSIEFADGSEFSAVDTDTNPLLTVSIPVGLQYGNNPEDITLRGNGNNLNTEFVTVDRTNRPVGLEVDTGNTLALIGGDVFLQGGNATAAEGRIVIGSAGSEGLVEIAADDLGWSFNYDEVDTFQNINLSEAASIEVSGDGGGEVSLKGREITIADGSAILADTLGNSAGRSLIISATEAIAILGVAADNFFPTRISTDVDLGATGDGGNIAIDTDYLLVADGAQITSGTFDLGDAGNLNIIASEIELIGESADGAFASGLFAQADLGETGDGGNLNIKTNSLFVADGAEISIFTFGVGNAGNLNIAAEEIALVGFGFVSNLASQFSVSTQGSGNGGNLQIETASLTIAGGAEISTTTFDSGNAGNLSIVAEEIALVGGAREVGSSKLSANTEAGSSGNGGDMNIKSDTLSITGGAQILALTRSIGDGGNIAIASEEIIVEGTSPGNNPSSIFADVVASEGTGGNIEISTDSLEVSEGAQIATSTSGASNGGNLQIIASDRITLTGSSPNGSSGLFANALAGDGAGGNIRLQTNLLSILNDATISVSNFPSSDNSPFTPGEGAAGNIDLIASEIFLDSQASINADTFAGDRGNIDIQTDLLTLRRESSISTDAQNTATGGNITIDASDGFIIAVPQENSDITANAVFGDGGRVDISVLEIFGIQPRANLTSFSDITASSEFGIAGTINLNNQDLNPTEDAPKLPQTPPPPQLARGCQAGETANSSFINLGQGGLNSQLDSAVTSDELIGDVRLPNSWQEESNGVVEAQNWIINERGNIVLMANSSKNLHCTEDN